MRKAFLIVLVLVAMLTVPHAHVRAQSEEKTPEQLAPSEYSATAATVERIMDQAVTNIAIRYNLNELQTQYTGDLMKREVRRFLREHEGEVWPAIRALLSAQFRTPSEPDEIKRIGSLTRPIAKLAADAIYRANEEWRQYLTDDQKKMHDFDMSEMRKTFSYVDENLSKWEKGEPVAGSGFFPTPTTELGPPVPPKPPIRSADGIPVVVPKTNILTTFVEEFIKEYNLDEAQIVAARSILAEFKTKADAFMNSKKDEFSRIAAKREEAERERDVKAIRLAMTEHKELLQPFYLVFGEMEERLKGLLTSTQIEEHARRVEEKRGAKVAGKEAEKEKPEVAKAQEPKPAVADKVEQPKPDEPKGNEPKPAEPPKVQDPKTPPKPDHD